MTSSPEEQIELVAVMREMQDKLNARIASDWRDRGFAWHRAAWVEAAEAAEHLPGDHAGSVAAILGAHAQMIDAVGWKWWKTLKDVDVDGLREGVGRALSLSGVDADVTPDTAEALPTREILQSLIESSAVASASFDPVMAETGGLVALARLSGAAPVPATPPQAQPLTEQQVLEQVQLEVVDLWHFALSAAEAETIPSQQLIDAMQAGMSEEADLAQARKIFGDLGLAALEKDWEQVSQYLGAAMQATDMDIDSLYAGYVEKNVLNFHRQNNGYNAKAGEAEYVKVWDGLEDNIHLKQIAGDLRAQGVAAVDLPESLMSALQKRYDQLTQTATGGPSM